MRCWFCVERLYHHRAKFCPPGQKLCPDSWIKKKKTLKGQLTTMAGTYGSLPLGGSIARGSRCAPAAAASLVGAVARAMARRAWCVLRAARRLCPPSPAIAAPQRVLL